jgi:hypothetical protein
MSESINSDEVKPFVVSDAFIKEVRETAFKAAQDYIKGRRASGKPASPSEGMVHAGCMTAALEEAESLLPVSCTDEDRKRANFWVLVELENGSALRQRLAKLEGFAWLKADKAGSVADDYL